MQAGYIRLSSWFLAVLCSSFVHSVQAADDNGWAYYGRDQGGARFSPLLQIDTTNVSKLELAWSYRHGDLERYPDRAAYAGFHATPILLPAEAGGALVACTPFSLSLIHI